MVGEISREEENLTSETAKNAEDAGKKQKPLSETLNIGDVMVSKSGARREIKSIVPDEKDPQKKVFTFERTGKSGSVKEETLDSDKLDSRMEAVDYTLTPDQQKRAVKEFRAMRDEHREKGWAWDEKNFKILAEKRIYEQDLKKKEDVEKTEDK